MPRPGRGAGAGAPARSLAALLLGLILLVAAGLRLWSLGPRAAVRLQPRRARALRPARGDDDRRGPQPGLLHQPAGADLPARGVPERDPSRRRRAVVRRRPGRGVPGARVVAVAFGVGAVAATYAAGRDGSAGARGWWPRRSWPSRSCRSSTRGWRSTTGRACCRARWRCGRRRSCCAPGARKALLAGGACVGLAASLKYSDGAIVIALVAAALLSPLSFKAGVQGPRASPG